jgi:hypothetical protein
MKTQHKDQTYAANKTSLQKTTINPFRQSKNQQTTNENSKSKPYLRQKTTSSENKMNP